MDCFVLKKLEEPLLQYGLYHTIRAICYGIAPSLYNIFAILERYNLDTCTFFTRVGEMGFSLHELFEVSGLSMWNLLYEEYNPGTEELYLLKKDVPQAYETYREILCHFYICALATGWRSGGLEELNKCHGLTSSPVVWDKNRASISIDSQHRH